MSSFYYQENNRKCKLELKEKISSGGEGEISRTNIQNLVAKIYKSISPKQREKLQIMVDNPPEDPMLSQGHISIAWPKYLIKDENNKDRIIGFLMPEIKNSKTLVDVYSHKIRREKFSYLDWRCLYALAQNIAIVVEAVHDKQYIIGDIKTQNFLISVDSFYLSIVDTDSFQIRDPKTGKIYRSSVYTREFTPPELLDRDLKAIDRLEVHDRFGLGVIIYYLLFGEHPFNGKWQDEELSSLEARIKTGSWQYGRNLKITPRKNTIPLTIVDPKLQEYFHRCFTLGHENLHFRPSAREWRKVLQKARNNLVECSLQSNHFYDKTYNKCFWCEFKSESNYDYFPEPELKQKVSTPTEKILSSEHQKAPSICLPTSPKSSIPNTQSSQSIPSSAKGASNQQTSQNSSQPRKKDYLTMIKNLFLIFAISIML